MEGTDVRLCRGAELEWIVWLGDRIAGRFTLLADALDLASILECSPRARAAVKA